MTEYFVSYAVNSEKYMLGFGCCVIGLEKFDLIDFKYKLEEFVNIEKAKNFNVIPIYVVKLKDLR